MACGQLVASTNSSSVETSPSLTLAMSAWGMGPPRNGSVLVAHDAMENMEHNLSRFLLKTAHLMESRGCRTVDDLLKSGALPGDPDEKAYSRSFGAWTI
jgi:hypothetical protein